jgi:hypothetical protein
MAAPGGYMMQTKVTVKKGKEVFYEAYYYVMAGDVEWALIEACRLVRGKLAGDSPYGLSFTVDKVPEKEATGRPLPSGIIQL